jgi:hypothetical protein
MQEEIEFHEPSPGLKEFMQAEKPKRKNAHFGRIPHWVIDTGVLEVLRPKAVKVILTLIRYADFTTGNGRIGNKKIAQKCDIFKQDIPGYFKEIKFFGVIETWRQGWVRYYHIQDSPPPDIKEKVEFYRKPDKCRRNTEIYQRDPKGRFARKET